ncbi:MAG: hypothetical protein CBE00_01845 [Planctomycetaceae bacterium TMED240]|nr:hypothetical protein [Rhodopirellula sp.]OUX08380.1 MAG: hypothetical protein CBE00_01845 [Planctomycetaceae bacterium TMED240]
MSKLLYLIGATLWTVCLLSTDSRTADADDLSSEVHFGIQGHYRVGAWTGIRYSGSQNVRTVETRDGDGAEVLYKQASDVTDGDWAYAVPGSEAAPLILRNGDTTISSGRFPTSGSPSRGPAMIPLDMNWIVVIGDPLGVDEVGANKLLNRDASIAVSMPTAPIEFPNSMIGYEGVDMIMINAAGIDLLQGLKERQRLAIEQWITGGGHLFITLGESCQDLFKAAPWLQKLLGITEPKITNIDPSAIETYTSTQNPLRNFTGLRLPRKRGTVLITGKTTRRVSLPVAAVYNIGFGRITAIAADLDDEMFTAWPERLDLMTQLTGEILLSDKRDIAITNRGTAYGDLAGQLRATLDQFEVKRKFEFSIISIILMALIAVIGPLDYLLINRFLGRPLLGWLSFPLVAILLTLVLMYEARPNLAEGISTTDNNAGILRCNRVEIIDIDAIAGLGRGFQASCIYSHDAALLNIDIDESNNFDKLTDSIQQSLLSPLGYPGQTYGGIQIAIEDTRMPPYTIRMQQSGVESTGFPGGLLQNSIVGAPLAARSSKSVQTLLRFKPKLTNFPNLQRRDGSELLRGELVNPLPVDLLDGMLVYRNWAYLLNTRFPAGGRIERIDSLRQKNFRWRLSRQTALESSRDTEEWDPSSVELPDRVAEMLMFHNAVGGNRYTGLRDDALSSLDLSHTLSDDRCVLIGRLADELTTLKLNNEEIEFEGNGKSLTMIRVILPVTSEKDL